MDLWQVQHFPVLSLKNYQLCVIVQNANIPMIAFKKSQTINYLTKKKKKRWKRETKLEHSRGMHSRKPKNQADE